MGSGEGLLLLSLRWSYSFNDTSFLCACLVSEKLGKILGIEMLELGLLVI